MSNKKWRRPAGDIPPESSPDQAPAPACAPAPEPAPELRPPRPEEIIHDVPIGLQGKHPDLRRGAPGITRFHSEGKPLTDTVMRVMLMDAAIFLHQVMRLVSGVLETVPCGGLRRAAADDLPLLHGCVDEDGTTVALTPMLVEDGQRTYPTRQHSEELKRKPREGFGPRHPLMALINLAMQAARLLRQIAGYTHPMAKPAKGELTPGEFDSWARKLMKDISSG